MLKEEVDRLEDITPRMLAKHLEHGLNHFRMHSLNIPKTDDELHYSYISMSKIIKNGIKGNPSKGIYLCPNIILSDLNAQKGWDAYQKLLTKLSEKPDLLKQKEALTMSLMPLTGKLNNGVKSQSYTKVPMLEVLCSVITNTTPIKPYLAYRDEGRYIHTTIIPDLDFEDMQVFIALYDEMLSGNTGHQKLLTKKLYKKGEDKQKEAKFKRPLIYNGNFPGAPQNAAFGVVGLLAAIGRWAKEANRQEEGQKVLDSLEGKVLYIVQYGRAQSITIHHLIVDLAKENKLSEIVSSIQRSEIIFPFDETKPQHSNAVQSRRGDFHLFSSRFLQLLSLASFRDFISIRAQYFVELIELFDIFFIKQMFIKKEVVDSARIFGLWLNKIAYFVGKEEAERLDKPKKWKDYKAKALVELESTVFGAREPADVLNVIVKAGRLSQGGEVPAEADVFTEALLTGEISLNNAKSMLMAYARIRGRYEVSQEKANSQSIPTNSES
jgi:hypothetical protein